MALLLPREDDDDSDEGCGLFFVTAFWQNARHATGVVTALLRLQSSFDVVALGALLIDLLALLRMTSDTKRQKKHQKMPTRIMHRHRTANRASRRRRDDDCKHSALRAKDHAPPPPPYPSPPPPPPPDTSPPPSSTCSSDSSEDDGGYPCLAHSNTFIPQPSFRKSHQFQRRSSDLGSIPEEHILHTTNHYAAAAADNKENNSDANSDF